MMSAPLIELCNNAGVEGQLVVQQIQNSRDGYGYGYNVATDTYEDLLKSGVVDPTKVTRSALQHATSVAGLLLTTECVITDIREDKSAKGSPDMDAMGGMGGMGGMM